jgi:hypothetical protein
MGVVGRLRIKHAGAEILVLEIESKARAAEHNSSVE